jgi:hypothetical protein
MVYGPFSRQARAELVWLLAGLAILNLGLAIAVECGLPEVRDPSYGYRLRRLNARRTSSSNGRPLVIMLGSSRTAFGFRAAEVSETLTRQTGRPLALFNFGIYGAGPITELLTFHRLRAAGVRPDLVLIEMTPAFLAGQQGAPREMERIAPARLSFRELPLLGPYTASSRNLQRGWWLAWSVPWYAHRYAILSRLAPAWLPFQLREDTWQHVDNSGSPAPYGGPELAPEGRVQATEGVRRQYAPYLSRFQLGAPACQALVDLLGRCRTDKIPAALVLMPEGTAFRSLYSSDAWLQIEGFLETLHREFGVPVIDARGWVADDGFSDSHHLLPDAALVFSARLGDEAVKLLGQEPPADSRLAGK